MYSVLMSELFVLTAMAIHIITCPGTKVEESFNVQATHDMIYHAWNVSAYDHISFPGVVPRSFTGPAFLALFGLPARFILSYFEIPKSWMLILVRFVLGFTVCIAFCNFARAVEKEYGKRTAVFLRIITGVQFHFLFYASRPLPNTFALFFVLMVYQRCMENEYYSAVGWATVAAFVFRCELVLLFGPIFIMAFFNGHIKFLNFHGESAIGVGIKTAYIALFSTIHLDSFLWQRPIWPEAEVAWFNVVENKSHEYGVSPFYWYFTSALPRSMLAAYLLFPFGLIVDRRVKFVVLPVLLFVFLYSFLPHKELRFIIYAIPVLNFSAAVVCARLEINQWKSWMSKIMYYGCWAMIGMSFLSTVVFNYASQSNYPGWNALMHVQHTMRVDAHKPISIYIDNMCAQTGVSRFTQLFDAWEYNKTESLTPQDMERFDFIIIGTYGNDLPDLIEKFSQWHMVMAKVPTFHRIGISHLKTFPFFWPEIQLEFKVAELRKKWEL